MNGGKPQISFEYLVANESFQKYCLKNDSEAVAYWEDFILKNWHCKEVFAKAFEAVVSLSDDRIYDGSNIPTKIIELSQRSNVNYSKSNPTSKSKKRFWLYPAAAILLCLFISTFLYLNQTPHTQLITETTMPGEVLTLELPDKSIVTLNGNSEISYSENMDGDRKVKLIGEAFFEVETTPNKDNFIVATPIGFIKVTGTKFNVNYRSEALKAVLVEGQIVFQKALMDDIILSPGDMIIVENNTIRITSDTRNVQSAWKDGRMVFKDASIYEIKQRLADVYGVEVIIENEELKSKKINANMVTSDPHILLKSLSLIYDFALEVEGNQVVIK